MADAAPVADITALRAEIDALDDAMHDLLMRRVEVVARLAASRAKGQGPALRPGREAAILRRLLARHRGPLPRATLVRIWRELLAATTALQTPLPLAAAVDDAGTEVLRAHLGLGAPIARLDHEADAIAAVLDGSAALAAVPQGGRWWRSLDPACLQATARLPFFGAAPTPVLLLSPAPPDPSGEDASLLRLPAPGAAAALAEAGLAPRALHAEDGLALAEVAGFLTPADPRLAAAGATLLGAVALPMAD